MKDDKKTKEQLIRELEDLRRGIAELKKTETGRKRAEEALRESEEKYRFLAFTEDPMYFVDRECRYRFMNKTHLLRLGLSLDKVIGRPYGEFHSEEDTKQFTDRVEAVFATGNSFQTEHKSERDNRDFLRTFSPVKDLQGNITDVTVISKDITERKQEEELLLASEARLKAQYQGSPIPIFTWQKKGDNFELVDYNNAAKVATEGEVIKFLGKTANEMYQDRQEILQDIHRCFTKKEIIKKELLSQDFMPGRTMVVTYIFVPPDLIMVYTGDITERKQAEEALRKSEEKFRTIIETIAEGYYENDLAGNLTFVNDAMARFLGYSRAEMMGMNNRQYTDAENAKILFKVFNRVYRTGETAYSIQYEVVTKSGEKKIVQTSPMLIRDPSGQPVGFRGISRDITDLIQIQEALRKSEERYRTILETIEDGYYEVDLAGNLTFFNDALTRIHGYPREELMGKSNRQYTNEKDSQDMYRSFNQVYRTGQPSKGIQYEIITQNGERKALETSVSLIRDSSGKPVGFRGIARDITELRQTQIALADSEERFRVVAESSNDFILEWNLKSGQMEWFGQAVEKLKDLLSEIPQTITAYRKIVHPEDLDGLIVATQQNLKKQGAFREEYRIIDKRGHTIYLRSAGTCLRDEKGKPYKWIGALSDITERKKREETLKTLSLKDDLTGLYNRRGFFTMAEQGLKMAQRMGTEMLIIYGDLDNLKKINDTLGHKEGDQALVDISQILKETFRESDIIARIGGDEFVVLAMKSDETSAQKLIDRFEKVLNDRHLQTKRSYKLSMSFGIACFDPQNPCSIDALFAQADKLMYENKQKRVDLFRVIGSDFLHISNRNTLTSSGVTKSKTLMR